MKNDGKVIVRFPPSPTGPMHIGSVRTALYNWLFARNVGGQFLLRIEDTDKERSKKEFEEGIYDSLKWLGLNWDNKEIKKQSDRGEVYKSKIQELIKNGSAYISNETGGKNKEVVRFHNPGGKIKFNDLIRGEVETDVGELGDFIIARNIDDVLYHFAVSVDDLEDKVTHIIRGEDHISNTPRQILIIEALGGERPTYAHLPLVLAPDKSKLSKRKHGESVSLDYYRRLGYLPEAIINFVAMVGWNPGTDQEIFSLEGLVGIFDIKKVQKKGGVFDLAKLRWVNKEYMKNRREESMNLVEIKLGELFSGKAIHPKLVAELFDRIEVVSDIDEMDKNGELQYFFEQPELDLTKITWKDQSRENAKANLQKILEILEKAPPPNPLPEGEGVQLRESFNGQAGGGKIMRLAEERGKGNVLWPLRYALSGREKSPDPFTLIDILGIEEAKSRIEKAIELLDK